MKLKLHKKNSHEILNKISKLEYTITFEPTHQYQFVLHYLSAARENLYSKTFVGNYFIGFRFVTHTQ